MKLDFEKGNQKAKAQKLIISTTSPRHATTETQGLCSKKRIDLFVSFSGFSGPIFAFLRALRVRVGKAGSELWPLGFIYLQIHNSPLRNGASSRGS
jgi:hypothetical protein